MHYVIINPVFKFSNIEAADYFRLIVGPRHGLKDFDTQKENGEILILTYGSIFIDEAQCIYDEVAMREF